MTILFDLSSVDIMYTGVQCTVYPFSAMSTDAVALQDRRVLIYHSPSSFPAVADLIRLP